MARIKNFVNGGTVLPSDLDAIEDDYECAFGTYKHLWQGTALVATGVSNTLLSDSAVQVASATVGWYVVYLDPARYWGAAATSSVNPRTVYYRIDAYAATNGTAPAATLTTTLVPLSGGTSSVTIGAAVTGSAAVIPPPAANSFGSMHSSGDFVAPAAGMYGLQVLPSTAVASGSATFVTAQLLARQV